MVWQNGKEGEFFIVEPISFRTSRSASSPFTFTYDIQLRTIERFDLRARLKDSHTEMNGRVQFLARMRNMSQSLSQGFVLFQSVVDSSALLGQKTLSTILSPANALLKGLTGVLTSVRGVFPIPRNTVAVLMQDLVNLIDELNQFKPELNAYKQFGIANKQSIAAHELKRMAHVCARVASEDGLFGETTGSVYNRKINAYRSDVQGLPRTGGDPTNLVNDPGATGTGRTTVFLNETIRSLSKRVLGNGNRWRQLVLLNNLKAPYLSPDGDGVNVLRPNDVILFPKAGTQDDSPIAADRTAKEIQADAFANRLGRDLKLKSIKGAGGIVTYDFEVNQRGDLATVEGTSNMKQAVLLKFEIEQGQLPGHPFFGIRAPIGEKARQRSLIAFQMNARASLLSDRRVEDLQRFDARIDGNVLSINADIKIEEIDQSVGIAFDVKR
jgi:hypothetical protein